MSDNFPKMNDRQRKAIGHISGLAAKELKLCETPEEAMVLTISLAGSILGNLVLNMPPECRPVIIEVMIKELTETLPRMGKLNTLPKEGRLQQEGRKPPVIITKGLLDNDQ